MDSSTTTALPRRQVTILLALAIAIIFVSGLFRGTTPTIIAAIGGVIALVGWAYATFIAARARQAGWIGMLVIGLLIAIALSAFAYLNTTTDTLDGVLAATQFGILPLAFITLGYGTLGAGSVMERGVAAFFGGWGLFTLVIGGTLVGGAIGTTIGAAAEYITAFGFRLYAIAGVLGLIAWIVGLVVGLRTQAWGWFAMIVLLPAIGAFMFGMFGPTRQDVIMAQESARERKAVGLN